MSNEEAIRCLSVHSSTNGSGLCTDKQHYEAKQLAIKALEQEPCEDCISRQAVQDYIAKYLSQYLYNDVREAVEVIDEYIGELPSVNPQPKTGHWTPVSERLPEKYTYTLWCASSGYVRSDYFNGEFWEDAKKLGYEVIAWMPLPKPYEPQERSDKE